MNGESIPSTDFSISSKLAGTPMWADFLASAPLLIVFGLVFDWRSIVCWLTLALLITGVAIGVVLRLHVWHVGLRDDCLVLTKSRKKLDSASYEIPRAQVTGIKVNSPFRGFVKIQLNAPHFPQNWVLMIPTVGFLPCGRLHKGVKKLREWKEARRQMG